MSFVCRFDGSCTVETLPGVPAVIGAVARATGDPEFSVNSLPKLWAACAMGVAGMLCWGVLGPAATGIRAAAGEGARGGVLGGVEKLMALVDQRRGKKYQI